MQLPHGKCRHLAAHGQLFGVSLKSTLRSLKYKHLRTQETIDTDCDVIQSVIAVDLSHYQRRHFTGQLYCFWWRKSSPSISRHQIKLVVSACRDYQVPVAIAIKIAGANKIGRSWDSKYSRR